MPYPATQSLRLISHRALRRKLSCTLCASVPPLNCLERPGEEIPAAKDLTTGIIFVLSATEFRIRVDVAELREIVSVTVGDVARVFSIGDSFVMGGDEAGLSSVEVDFAEVGGIAGILSAGEGFATGGGVPEGLSTGAGFVAGSAVETDLSTGDDFTT